MTENQIKIIELYDNADESGKDFILNTLACAVAFGDEFYKEMEELTAKGDKGEIKAFIAKYTAILKERETA